MSISDFLEKNISIVNKNTLLCVDFGRKISCNIFDKRFPTENLPRFFQLLEDANLHYKKYKMSHMIIYKSKNTIISVSKSQPYKQTLMTYSTLESLQDSHANLSMIHVSLTKNYVSHFHYDDIETIERFTATYSRFTIHVDKHPQHGFFTVKLILSKPTDSATLHETLGSLISLTKMV